VTTRGVQLTRGKEPIGHCNDINRFASVDQERDLAKNGTVFGAVEIAGSDDLGHAIPTIRGNEKCTQD
jgi:hypothetical protein